MLDAVAAEEVGEVGDFAPRDLGGAEALFHEFKGGVAERGESAFGAVEEAGKELVGESVDAVGGGGLLADEGAAAAGDFGDPKHLGKLYSLCAYAGIVPRTHQSGGPYSPAIQGHASPRCNRILKDWTVQSAQKIHLYGPPELKDRITRWNAEGRHGIFAAARHHLRLVHTLVKNEHPYLAPQARTRQATPDQIAGAAQATLAILQRKWRTVSGGLDLILDEAHPLGFWRKVMLELHGIDLPERQ
mgnify:CR=1 FL=1